MSSRQQIVHERLQELADRNGGSVTADMVVEDARPKGSPLHDFFEWDVKAAARRHWIDTARRLIRSVQIVVRTETRSVAVPGYVRDPRAEPAEQKMVSVARIRTDRDHAREALVDQFRMAMGALHRAHALATVFEMEDDVDAIIASITTLQTRVVETEGVHAS